MVATLDLLVRYLVLNRSVKSAAVSEREIVGNILTDTQEILRCS